MEFYYEWFWSKLIDDLNEIYKCQTDWWSFTYKRKACDHPADEYATPFHHVPLPYHGIGDFFGFDFKWVGLSGVFLMEPISWAHGCPLNEEELYVFPAPVSQKYSCEWPMQQEMTYTEKMVYDWLVRNWDVEDDISRDDFPPLRPISMAWLDVLDAREQIAEHLTNQWLRALPWQSIEMVDHFYNWVCNEIEDHSYYNSLLLFFCIADLFESLYEKCSLLYHSYSLHANENIFYASIPPNVVISEHFRVLQKHVGDKIDMIEKDREQFILHNIYVNIAKMEQFVTTCCSRRYHLSWAAICADSLCHSTMYYTIEKQEVPWDRNISFIIMEYMFKEQMPEKKQQLLKTKQFYDGYLSFANDLDYCTVEDYTEIIKAGVERTEALWT